MYNTRNYIQYLVIISNGKESEKYIYIYKISSSKKSPLEPESELTPATEILPFHQISLLVFGQLPNKSSPHALIFFKRV